ncbi:MAG: hypothetical protein OES79_06055 [Planctomycetota bacterium]|nr:hypothetical protein [Planctomycetota bacterium]
MQQSPAYGVYPWWPENGHQWIHPEDIEVVDGLIPGARVFRRDGRLPKYVVMSYGDMRFRIRPTLWHQVQPVEFDIGDQVEIRSRMGKNLPGLAVICEMTWQREQGTIYYHLRQRGMRIPRRFTAADLRPVKFLSTEY